MGGAEQSQYLSGVTRLALILAGRIHLHIRGILINVKTKLMVDTAANNKRIAKNTILLYIRMLFMMAVSLYTSRVVLNVLGVEDYGIYNVVGGVVTMFGFLNGAMASSTQRYLTFELGRNDFKQLHKVFCTSIAIHGLISIVIVILAETIGLWFLYYKMTIPEMRMDAALWVYQFSILSFVVMIMSVPYNATIIAHEKMSAFAYISVMEVVLKLLIVYLLLIGDFDKLKLYAVLIFLVQLCIRCIYSVYCNKHFAETKYRRMWNSKLFKEMLCFAGWNMWGSCAAIAFTQGLNILLNMFFGPVVNAARGVAVQVQSAVTQFSMNFQTALNPQITKSYAVEDYVYMHSLIFRSSKFTFFLLLFLSLPIMVETETILRIWLKIVPDYAVVFLRLMICITILDAVANPLMVSAAATGKVRRYQSIVGGVLLSILPISYVVLKLGGAPYSVFIVHLCVCFIAFVIRLFIIRLMIKLPLIPYFKQVVIRSLAVTVLAVILPLLLKMVLPETLWSFFLICVVCLVSVAIIAYCCGLSFSEREFVRSKLQAVFLKLKRR